MNKSEFVAAVAGKSNLSGKEAQAAIEGMLSVLKELPVGEKVTLVGFGSFEKSRKEAETKDNPFKKGEKVESAARDVLKVKVSKAFLAA